MTASNPKNDSTLTTEHDIDRLPLYYVWPLLPSETRLMICKFAFYEYDFLLPEHVEQMADCEWQDIKPGFREKIMTFFKSSAIQSWKLFLSPGRKEFTPINNGQLPERALQ